jgi:hypothetical protein
VKGIGVPKSAGGTYELEHITGLVEGSIKEMTLIGNTNAFIKRGVIDDKINCQIKALYSLPKGGTDEKVVLDDGYISWGNTSICSFTSIRRL